MTPNIFQIANPTRKDRTIIDLIEHELDTGIPLPMPAAVIAEIERRGGVVDLESGAICDHIAPEL